VISETIIINDDMHCEINSERFLASVYVL